MMRRQGQYADPGANAYSAQMQHISAQRIENRSDTDHFQGRLEAFTPEREHPYVTSKAGQWRWERDESKMSNPMASHILSEGQGVDASRSYFQGKGLGLGPGPEPKLALEKQGINDPRFGPCEEDMQIGFEDKPLLQTFEGIQQKFLDNILKLAKEQNDAEDAENARHREKINAINNQYREQLAALRSRHASRRSEYLCRESQARRRQYQQAVMNRYPSNGMDPGDAHGYSGVALSVVMNEAHQAYNTNNFKSYRERAQFYEGSKNHGFEPSGPYHGGCVYDTGTNYYY